MRHEEAVELLPELPHGRLGAALAEEVAAHRDGCEECRELARTYAVLAATIRGEEDAPEEHPSPAAIVAWALGGEGEGASDLARTEAHLALCEECSREADQTRLAEREAAGRVVPFSSPVVTASRVTPRARLAAAIAAAIVVAVLGYPAFLGVYRLPRVLRDLDTQRQLAERAVVPAERDRERDSARERDARLAATSGRVEIRFLAVPTRGGGPQRILLAPGERELLIAVAPELEKRDGKGQIYRFEIVAAGAVSWSAELPADRVRQDLASPQAAVVLSIPREALPAGSCEFRVRHAGSNSAILAIPLEIVR